MGWSPQMFWDATLAEYVALVAGWNRAQTGGVTPMARSRLDELIMDYGGSSPSIRRKD